MSVKEWHDFLLSQAVQIEDNWVTHCQSPASSAAQQNRLCALTQLACVEVKGDDAQNFLHNQLSNDIRQLDHQTAQLAAYCSAQGRVITLFWIFKQHSSYFLLMPRDRVEATVKRLRMFVLMSKVEINDVSDDWHCLGIFGAHSAEALRSLSVEASATTLGLSHGDGLIAIRCHGELPRYLLIVNHAQAQQTWLSLASQASCVATREWIAEDIRDGVPQVYQATTEAFVPQMLNLHSLDAISFTKGCYPGQEVVARMKYLGKLKRRMFHAEIESEHSISVGDDILAEDEKPVGKVVDIAPLADHRGYRLLAVLLVSASEEPLHIKGNTHYHLNIKDLPYQVELERT